MKYFKPKSLTWWGGVFAVGSGIVLLLQGETENGIAMINGGLITIGVRGALK